MRQFFRGLLAAAFAGGLFAGAAMPALAQDDKDKGEDTAVPTVDGLRLLGTWYAGNKGRNSDTVIMLHGYGSNATKGEWQSLAKALAAEGFSVLTFDFRGHNRSGTAKAISSPKDFCNLNKFTFNKLSGETLDPNRLTSLNYKKFSGNYFPYLVNDIAAARRFCDQRNDNGECNTGRLYIIAEKEMCSLALLWMGTEFFRQAIYPQQGGVGNPARHEGSRDLVGAVWLSFRRQQTVDAAVNRLVNQPNIARGEINAEQTLREKIGMAFVYSDEDKTSAQVSRGWLNQFRVRPDAKEDKELGKYLIEVKGAKSSTGIELLSPKLGVEKQIIEFMKATRKKNVAGVDNQPRNTNSKEPEIVDLTTYFGYPK